MRRYSLFLVFTLFFLGCSGEALNERKNVTSSDAVGTTVSKVKNDEVSLTLPKDSFPVHSFQQVDVTIGSNVPCSFDELSLTSTGSYNDISVSKGDNFQPTSPTFRLLSGGVTGNYHLTAKCNGQVVGKQSFHLTNSTPEGAPPDGPTLWTGNKTYPGPTDTPLCSNNVNSLHNWPVIKPAETRAPAVKENDLDVLAMMVQFSDNKWGKDGELPFPLRRNFFLESLSEGVSASDPYSATFSSASYFEEMSGGNTSVNVTIPSFPVTLPAKEEAVMWNANRDLNEKWGPAYALGNTQNIINTFERQDYKNNGSFKHNVLNYDAVMFIFKDTVYEPAKIHDYPRSAEKHSSEMDAPCDGLDNDWDGHVDEQDPEVPAGYCGDGTSCGNGWVDANTNEQCDDGNNLVLDKCSNCEPTGAVSSPGKFVHLPLLRNRTIKNWKGNSKTQHIIQFSDRISEKPGFHGRPAHSVGSHELFHILDAGASTDLYPNGQPSFSLGRYDLMGWSTWWSHVNLKYRYEAGWIPEPEKNIAKYDPRSQGGGTKKTVHLRPVETLQARNENGHDYKLGAQVFLGCGRYMYIEYRLGQTSQLGDNDGAWETEDSGQDGDVMVTQFYTNPPAGTRFIQWPGGHSQLLEIGDQLSFPLNPSMTPSPELKVTIDNIKQTSPGKHEAVVDISVDELEADPSIRDWKKAESGWKSKDIEIRNKRNETGPNKERWENQPLFGAENKVVAHVRNNGEKSASGVEVTMEEKDFNASGHEQFFENVDQPKTKTVGLSGETEFSFDWTPPPGGHRCFRALIDGGYNDANPNNNVAHSNYTGDWTGAASPASREHREITISNPYDESVRYDINLEQSHPHFRTYLEHRWVTVRPGASKKVDVSFEYSKNFPKKYKEKTDYKPENYIEVTTSHRPPEASRKEPRKKGGVGIKLYAGYQTDLEVEPFTEENNTIFGTVKRVHGQKNIDGGEAFVIVERYNGTKDFYRGSVQGGDFAISVNLTDWDKVKVQYLGLYPNNPTSFKVFRR
jgi:hypothetical protein